MSSKKTVHITKTKKTKTFSWKRFGISWLIFVGILTFVRIQLINLNNGLSISVQSKQFKISKLERENGQLAIETQSLLQMDRVFTIAEQSGMTVALDRVVSLVGFNQLDSKTAEH